MRYKIINGIKIPVLGIGTWGMGGEAEKDTSHDKECINAIKTAIKLGMTHIDTAEFYGNGHSEELVGEAIKDFDREKLFITTKVNGDNVSYDEVLEAIKKSLSRLNTDYIDLYLIHWPNPNVPIKETMRAMDYLVEQKSVRHIGVSNFSLEQLKEAEKHAKSKVAAMQVEYNLLVRDKGRSTDNMESEILPYCQENNIIFIAWRPLGNGQLANPGFSLLDEISRRYKKTQAQVALNWLVSKEKVITIPKAVGLEHITENLGAIDWQLSEEDVAKLDGGS